MKRDLILALVYYYCWRSKEKRRASLISMHSAWSRPRYVPTRDSPARYFSSESAAQHFVSFGNLFQAFPCIRCWICLDDNNPETHIELNRVGGGGMFSFLRELSTFRGCSQTLYWRCKKEQKKNKRLVWSDKQTTIAYFPRLLERERERHSGGVWEWKMMLPGSWRLCRGIVIRPERDDSNRECPLGRDLLRDGWKGGGSSFILSRHSSARLSITKAIHVAPTSVNLPLKLRKHQILQECIPLYIMFFWNVLCCGAIVERVVRDALLGHVEGETSRVLPICLRLWWWWKQMGSRRFETCFFLLRYFCFINFSLSLWKMEFS